MQKILKAQLARVTRDHKSQAPDLAQVGVGAFHGLKVRVCSMGLFICLCMCVYVCVCVCMCVCSHMTGCVCGSVSSY